MPATCLIEYEDDGYKIVAKSTIRDAVATNPMPLAIADAISRCGSPRIAMVVAEAIVELEDSLVVEGDEFDDANRAAANLVAAAREVVAKWKDRAKMLEARLSEKTPAAAVVASPAATLPVVEEGRVYSTCEAHYPAGWFIRNGLVFYCSDTGNILRCAVEQLATPDLFRRAVADGRLKPVEPVLIIPA